MIFIASFTEKYILQFILAVGSKIAPYFIGPKPMLPGCCLKWCTLLLNGVLWLSLQKVHTCYISKLVMASGAGGNTYEFYRQEPISVVGML
jgi:hypothetical protein